MAARQPLTDGQPHTVTPPNPLPILWHDRDTVAVPVNTVFQPLLKHPNFIHVVDTAVVRQGIITPNQWSVLAANYKGKETFFSFMGDTAEYDKPERHAGIRFCAGHAKNGYTFAGFEFRIKRDKDAVWNFPPGHEYHIASIRMHSGQFRMRYRKLSEQERQKLGEKTEIPDSAAEILAIEFAVLDGCKTYTNGLSWPGSRPRDAAEFMDPFQAVANGNYFVLYSIDAEAPLFTLFNSARALAERQGNEDPVDYLMSHGRANIAWNPKLMAKKSPLNLYGSAGGLVVHNARWRFYEWADFATRYGWSCVFEQLYVSMFVDAIRNFPVAAQWIRINGEEENEYYVSLRVPTLQIPTGSLLQAMDELHICFAGDTPTQGQEKEVGWRAMVIDHGSIRHYGSHLLRVTRPFAGWEGRDDRTIESFATYTSTNRHTPVFLRLTESEKTVKVRLNGIQRMDPVRESEEPIVPNPKDLEAQFEVEDEWEEQYGGDDGDTIFTSNKIVEDLNFKARGYEFNDENEDANNGDMSAEDREFYRENLPEAKPPFLPPKLHYYTFRSIIMGCNVVDMRDEDWLAGVAPHVVHLALSRVSSRSRQDLLKILRGVPSGLLAIQGAAGVGKTTILICLAKIFIMSGKKVFMSASLNSAVNNFANRATAALPESKALIVRLHPEQAELGILDDFDPAVGPPSSFSQEAGRVVRSGKWTFKESVAAYVLRLVGVIDTHNEKLLALRDSGKYDFLKFLLEMPRKERKLVHKKLLGKWAKAACIEIMEMADILCGTPIGLCDTWARTARVNANVLIVDEVTSMPLAELMAISGGQEQKLIIAGDPQQLGVPNISSNIKFTMPDGEKIPVNPLHGQFVVSLMDLVLQNNWPTWLIPEEHRVKPGQFDLVNKLFYHDRIQYHPDNVITKETTEFEEWAVAHGRRYGSTVQPSPDSKVLPVFIDVRASYTYKEPNGSSKGNSGFLHFGLDALLSLVNFKNGFTITGDDILVVTPYNKQVSEWRLAVTRYPILNGIKIMYPDGVQGLERKYVLWDQVIAAGDNPAFLSNERRTCVTLSRHVHGLIVVGDMSVAHRYDGGPGVAVTNNGKGNLTDLVRNSIESQPINTYLLSKIFGYFKATNRVIKVNMVSVTHPKVEIVTRTSACEYATVSTRQREELDRQLRAQGFRL